MAVYSCKSMLTLFPSFCDKMLIDPLNYFRKGSLFSNELRFDLEAQMNQLREFVSVALGVNIVSFFIIGDILFFSYFKRVSSLFHGQF